MTSTRIKNGIRAPRNHLVIGGTGGIGSAIVRILREDGDRVHVIARDRKKLSALAAEIGALHAVADVTDGEAIESAVAAATSDGALHSLTYAVGSIDLRRPSEVTRADLMAAFDLNVSGALAAIGAAIPAADPASGAVLLFSSVAAQTGFPRHSIAGTVKAAVEGLTRSLAADLAPRVRVNCLAPGLVVTPLSAPMAPSTAARDGLAGTYPLARLGEPGDLAEIAVALLSADSWMTGQVIPVDGGRGRIVANARRKRAARPTSTRG